MMDASYVFVSPFRKGRKGRGREQNQLISIPYFI
jgi:hypothetical protein